VSAALPRTTLVRQFDTYRLLPSRFAAREDSVLGCIADDDAHLVHLFELDNATNERLRAERGLLPGIGEKELVFGLPNFRLVNAAFTYAHPQGSRFNGPDRGAWYCAFEIETALAEVSFHKSVEYQEIGRFEDTVSYEVLLADFTHEFHDLRRDTRFASCLDPASYLASQRLAARLLDKGSVGIVYPSVRRPRGTNLACFRPAIVGNVRRGDSYRLIWSNTLTPKIELLKRAPKSRTRHQRT
jgi:RES domain-containing protein